MVVDARDVAQAMIRAVECGQRGERYIVGGEYQSLETIVKTLSKVSGLPAPRLRLPYPVALTYAWVAETLARLRHVETVVTLEGLRALQNPTMISSAKAIRDLGATFRSLEDTLRDEVAWYRQQAV